MLPSTSIDTLLEALVSRRSVRKKALVHVSISGYSGPERVRILALVFR